MSVDREQVLRAAATLLVRSSGATMDEVARAAGISRATLHRHFAGRDALVRALEELGLRECEAAVEAARVTEGSAEEAVRRVVAELQSAAPLLSFLITENQLFQGDQVNEGWARLDRRFGELFTRGQLAGEFRIDLTPVWLTEALYALIGSCGWCVVDGRVAAQDYPHMVTELMLGGARRNTP
ncbi:TetR/AcrR family transcriptional regulator [Streptomyces sp. NPDC049954]|uniref:TetR/AcrR family transcriptional regulator n=1 Tax=Streptomyces sp. NPDC049954 TaxID=3155779 RepID=UPI0034225F99